LSCSRAQLRVFLLFSLPETPSRMYYQIAAQKLKLNLQRIMRFFVAAVVDHSLAYHHAEYSCYDFDARCCCCPSCAYYRHRLQSHRHGPTLVRESRAKVRIEDLALRGLNGR